MKQVMALLRHFAGWLFPWEWVGGRCGNIVSHLPDGTPYTHSDVYRHKRTGKRIKIVRCGLNGPKTTVWLKHTESK